MNECHGLQESPTRSSNSWLITLGAAVMAASMYVFFSWVLLPAQKAEAAAENMPRGNLSDLYPRWLGARELLLNKRDPYDEEVTTDIQKGLWGRKIDTRNPNDPRDEARFAYPLYVVFLLAPTIGLPFPFVQALFVGFALIASVVSVWCWVYVTGTGRRTFYTVVASMLLVGSWPYVLALNLQQPVLIVFALVSVAMMAITTGALAAAGPLLALAMIKPQAAAPIILWLFIWAVADWRHRKALIVSFGLSFATLLAGAELLLPGWIWEWREAILAYMRYEPGPGPYVQLIFGTVLGNVLGLLFLCGLTMFCWQHENTRRMRANSNWRPC